MKSMSGTRAGGGLSLYVAPVCTRWSTACTYANGVRVCAFSACDSAYSRAYADARIAVTPPPAWKPLRKSAPAGGKAVGEGGAGGRVGAVRREAHRARVGPRRRPRQVDREVAARERRI